MWESVTLRQSQKPTSAGREWYWWFTGRGARVGHGIVSFRLGIEASLTQQCYASGSRVLLLSYLANGWWFMPIYLRGLDPKVRRRVLCTRHLEMTPAELVEALGQRWVPPPELNAALLACFNAGAATSSSSESGSDSESI